MKNLRSLNALSGRFATSWVLALFLALITLSVIMLPAGCSKMIKELNSELGQSTTLSAGQTISITGEPLQIKFLKIINDSRCPTGVKCPWEGEVDCLVQVTYENSPSDLVLTKRGSGSGSTNFNNYEITFEVTPYPQANKQTPEQDYRLQLSVNKKSELSGGILVTFNVVGELYSIFITNPDTIEQFFAVDRGESAATIPSGKLIRGTAFYNQPWSWYIDSEDIHMAEFTIELCDGTPSQVEANLDYWVDTVQRFCPWSAKIDRIEDFR